MTGRHFKYQNIHNILVIKLRNIGDVLLTTPVFSNLRAHFQTARISALVNSGTEEMLTDNPVIDNVYVYDRGMKKAPLGRRIAAELSLMGTLRRERFDLVINLTEGDRGAIIALLSGAGIRVGVDAAGRGMAGKNLIFTHLVGLPLPEMHTVEQNLRFLTPIGVPVKNMQVSFAVGEQDRAVAAARLDQAGLIAGRFIHAHLTSRWMFKTMPPDKAAYLVEQLARKTGFPVVFTAAPETKELEYLQQVTARMTAASVNLGGGLTLKQLGALAGQAGLFVGVDSAPMHMAAAVDVPVLGVFGPSSATQWGPWDNRLMKNPYGLGKGIQTSTRHLVLQADRQCVPCHRDGCNGSKVSDCLDFSLPDLEAVSTVFLASLAE